MMAAHWRYRRAPQPRLLLQSNPEPYLQASECGQGGQRQASRSERVLWVCMLYRGREMSGQGGSKGLADIGKQPQTEETGN